MTDHLVPKLKNILELLCLNHPKINLMGFILNLPLAITNHPIITHFFYLFRLVYGVNQLHYQNHHSPKQKRIATNRPFISCSYLFIFIFLRIFS